MMHSPRRSRRAVRTILAILPSLALSACEPADPVEPEVAVRRPPPSRPSAMTVGDLVREYRPTLDDPLQLYDPADLEVASGQVYIVERGNDRVTVTDTLFHLIRRFGRRGAGPGELEMPWGVERLPSGKLAITEIGNSRISLFTPAGRFIRSIPRATPHDTPAGLDDTTFVVPGPGGDFGAGIRYGRDGVGRPFGPPGGPARELHAITADPATRVWVDRDDRVALIRAGEGIVELLDGQGRRLRTDTIPRDVLTRVERRRRGLVESLESQGHRVVSSSQVKRPSATSYGELLIPLSLPDPFALIYSPRDGRFSRLNASAEPRERAILRSASALFLDGELLYAIQDGGIAVFRLPGR